MASRGDEIVLLRPADEVILEGKWMDHFTAWLSEHDGVIRRPEQTTVLNWKTKE